MTIFFFIIIIFHFLSNFKNIDGIMVYIPMKFILLFRTKIFTEQCFDVNSMTSLPKIYFCVFVNFKHTLTPYVEF